jgi:hypothetical protein
MFQVSKSKGTKNSPAAFLPDSLIKHCRHPLGCPSRNLLQQPYWHRVETDPPADVLYAMVLAHLEVFTMTGNSGWALNRGLG